MIPGPLALLDAPGVGGLTRWLAADGADASAGSSHVFGLLAGFVLFAAVMLIILFLISRSLRTLRLGAERFAQGDLSQQITVDGPLQVASVAESLNTMAMQLDDRLKTVVQQRNELEAVLASMIEAVLAVDRDERLLNLNRAAASLLGLDISASVGRTFHELIRNPAIAQFVTAVLASGGPVEEEIVFARPIEKDGQITYEDRLLQAQGTALRDSSGRRIGGLVVLHDVTRLHKLENIRRDFVANVSHELKTPISTIKAAAETLLETIEETVEQDDGTPNFVRIIARQADRLNAIVEDLLALARLEQEDSQDKVAMDNQPIAQVLDRAMETCQAKAAARRVRMELKCDPTLTAWMNARLIEQAVVNLLDNAIKYSPPGKQVLVTASVDDESAIISVIDEGPGVEPEHQPRLFERFYRTDKARSRELGGTGLGLAIVKHVAQVHGGVAAVQSALGKGSTFSIILPHRLQVPTSQ